MSEFLRYRHGCSSRPRLTGTFSWQQVLPAVVKLCGFVRFSGRATAHKTPRHFHL